MHLIQGLYLLWRAISGIKNGLVRDVVCTTTQVCAGSQVNQLESLLILCEDDVHGLDVSVYEPCCMEGLHSISRSIAHVFVGQQAPCKIGIASCVLCRYLCVTFLLVKMSEMDTRVGETSE